MNLNLHMKKDSKLTPILAYKKILKYTFVAKIEFIENV